jgi:hypothetical protein
MNKGIAGTTAPVTGLKAIQHLHDPLQMISVSEARNVKGKEELTEQMPP